MIDKGSKVSYHQKKIIKKGKRKARINQDHERQRKTEELSHIGGNMANKYNVKSCNRKDIRGKLVKFK